MDWRQLPPYFTLDSIERGVFRPERDDYASSEQIAALKSDAEFYCHQFGPDMCPAGLKQSARAVLKRLLRA